MRMFAGPNGSGKTTVKNGLKRSPQWFGIYINPDDLEKAIRETGVLSLSPFGLTTTTEEIRNYFTSSTFLLANHLNTQTEAIEVRDETIQFRQMAMNSYYASVLSDFLRRKALESANRFPLKP
jgi:hypothetical protein